MLLFSKYNFNQHQQAYYYAPCFKNLTIKKQYQIPLYIRSMHRNYMLPMIWFINILYDTDCSYNCVILNSDAPRLDKITANITNEVS